MIFYSDDRWPLWARVLIAAVALAVFVAMAWRFLRRPLLPVTPRWPGVELHPECKADGITLADWLRERGVDTVDVAGIATDHGVRATALDSADLGLHTTVRLELTAGVSPATVTRAMAELRRADVTLAEAPTTSA